MNKELRFLSYLTICNVLVGSILYFKIKLPTELSPKPFPLFVNADQVYTDYARGYTTLLNCNYFIKMYPRFRKALIKHNEVFFAYSNDPIMKENYAVTVSNENIIYLGDAFFEVKDANYREGIIGHELLHIVGMPDHKNDNMTQAETIKDPIYTVEHFCFHNDKPWTGSD